MYLKTERMAKDDMLSPYRYQLKEDMGLKEPSIAKLLPQLHDKNTQYKNSKSYLDLDMKVTMDHRITMQSSANQLYIYATVNELNYDNRERLHMLTRAPLFDHCRIFTIEIAAVNLKITLYLNCPIMAPELTHFRRVCNLGTLQSTDDV